MKKNNTTKQSPKRRRKASKESITIGMDLVDKTSRYCMIDGNGDAWKPRRRRG